MNRLKALFPFVLLACSLSTNAQRIKGSDTVLPVSQETAENFMKDDPHRQVTVTGGGTGVGISALMDNTSSYTVDEGVAKIRVPYGVYDASSED